MAAAESGSTPRPARPVLRWAQRADVVLLTFETANGGSARLTVQEGGRMVALSGVAHPVEGLRLHGPVATEDPEGAPEGVTPHAVFYRLHKAEAGWWPRLTAGPQVEAPVVVLNDWQQWAPDPADGEDEDECDGFVAEPFVT